MQQAARAVEWELLAATLESEELQPMPERAARRRAAGFPRLAARAARARIRLEIRVPAVTRGRRVPRSVVSPEFRARRGLPAPVLRVRRARQRTITLTTVAAVASNAIGSRGFVRPCSRALQ